MLWDCVPSKTFIASTGVRTELRRAHDLGFDLEFEDAKISLPRSTSGSRRWRPRSPPISPSGCCSEGVTLIAGRGELSTTCRAWPSTASRSPRPTAPSSVLKADVVLIATGASPRVLPARSPTASGS